MRSGPGDGRVNIDQRYTVDLSRERSNGTWRLQVRDQFWGFVGFLDSWTLTL